MQLRNRVSSLTVVVILSIIALAIPSTPALAATMATLALSQYSGPVGTQVTITGYFDNTSAGTVSANANGNFSGLTVTVPESSVGNHRVKVSDAVGSSQTFNYTVSPTLAAVGGTLSISGNGFAASSAVNFSLDNIKFSATANTTATGGLPATMLTIPTIPAGSHTLKAIDGSGASATYTVSTSSTLKINPQSGPEGTLITLVGTGYGASKTVIISFNGSNIASNPTIESDPNGNFVVR